MLISASSCYMFGEFYWHSAAGWLVVIVQDLKWHSSYCTFVFSLSTHSFTAAVFCICWVHSQMLVYHPSLDVFFFFFLNLLLVANVANISVLLWQNDINVEMVKASADNKPRLILGFRWVELPEVLTGVLTWAEGRLQLLHVPLSFPSYHLFVLFYRSR